jgi:hypothetical protein
VHRSVGHERVRKAAPAGFATEGVEFLGGERTAADPTPVRPPTENVVLSDDVFETLASQLAGLILQDGFGGLPLLPGRGRKASRST